MIYTYKFITVCIGWKERMMDRTCHRDGHRALCTENENGHGTRLRNQNREIVSFSKKECKEKENSDAPLPHR